jgi:hypothetical protein
VLLPEKANTIEHLPRACASCLEALPEICVFHLEALDALGIHSRSTWRGLEHLHPRFCLQGAPAESCKLVTQVTNELVKLVECLLFRKSAV